jgi:hypothetical protein
MFQSMYHFGDPEQTGKGQKKKADRKEIREGVS